MSSSLIRHDVLPVGVGYLLVMGALALGLRLSRRGGDPAPAGDAGRPEGGQAAGWLRLVYALASWLTAGRRDRAARRRGQAPRHPAPPAP
jgi:hypothetical protein